MKRVTSRILVLTLSWLVVLYPSHLRADIATMSNGVTVQELTAVGDSAETVVSYGGESMSIVHTPTGAMQDTLVIDGELVLVFNWTVSSSGETILDSSTYSYAGQSASRFGHQDLYQEPCYPSTDPDYTCPEPVLHPAAVSQVELLETALGQLHSNTFLQAVISAESELATQGRWACGFAIAGHVGSWVSIAGCATGVGCVLWIALHVSSGYNVAKNCSGVVRR